MGWMRWLWGLVLLAACDQVLGLIPPKQFDDAPIPGEAALAPTLLGWWKLDDGSGVVAADASGNNHPGTLTTGAMFVGAARNGLGAVMLDGSTDHDVDIADSNKVAQLQPTGSMTITAWVNASQLPQDSVDNEIVSHSNYPVGSIGWNLKVTNDCGPTTFAVQVGAPPIGTNSAQAAEQCSNTQPVVGTWYQVAGVYDASAIALHIYVGGRTDDGVANGADNLTSMQFEPMDVDVEIGNGDPANQVSGGMSGFAGMIQDVRIYGSALTPTEIAALAQ